MSIKNKLKLIFIAISIFTNNAFASCNPLDMSWWCDIKHGLSMATTDAGKDGIILSGLAYHLSVAPHWPTGFWQDGAGMLNETPYGIGYTRSYFNPEYNSQYSIFFLTFADSYWQPETHVGYIYQKYLDINNSGSWKWGYGYMLGAMIKLAYAGAIPLPAAGLTTSLRYKDVSLQLTYGLQLLLTLQFDIN